MSSVMTRFLMLLSVIAVVTGCASSSLTDRISACEIAARYIDAANRSDPGLIAPLLNEDVDAIFLSATSDHAETITGRRAVLEAVRTYKEHCPSCTSQAICHLQTASTAYVTEFVRFEDESGVKEQRAPLVIEIDANGVTRIIYFPSE